MSENLPLKALFQTWLVEEERLSKKSAGSYCSYAKSACKQVLVNDKRQTQNVLVAIESFIKEGGLERFQRVMEILLASYSSADFLTKINRPAKTAKDWRSGLRKYLEFVSEYILQQKEVEQYAETLEPDLSDYALLFEDENKQIPLVHGITEYNKEYLYNNFHFRLITQDRYYKNILYPIGLMKRLFYKTGRKEVFDKIMNGMLDKTLIYIQDGSLSLANITSLRIHVTGEVEVCDKNNIAYRAYTPMHEGDMAPLNIRTLQQVSLDHVVSMYCIMTAKPERFTEINKLNHEVKKRIKGNINYKKMTATYTPIIDSAGNLEAFVNYDALRDELAELCNEVELQLMDRRENTKKGKK